MPTQTISNKEPMALTGVQLFSRRVADRLPGQTQNSVSRFRKMDFLAALKYWLMVPVFPMLGYYLLDQTGVSAWMVGVGLIPAAILGEGFGHVGLCFSIHYVFKGIQFFVKALNWSQ